MAEYLDRRRMSRLEKLMMVALITSVVCIGTLEFKITQTVDKLNKVMMHVVGDIHKDKTLVGDDPLICTICHRD